MIRAFSALVMLCVLALISGAPAWVIYLGACAAVVVVLIKEPRPFDFPIQSQQSFGPFLSTKDLVGPP